jgi:hypothetical protein
MTVVSPEGKSERDNVSPAAYLTTLALKMAREKVPVVTNGLKYTARLM